MTLNIYVENYKTFKCKILTIMIMVDKLFMKYIATLKK